uniref:Uncharacterized protein n=1 Tax=Anguilla anguilla TaxID=7936 RepID=A0A0E9TTZ2_ANGAN
MDVETFTVCHGNGMAPEVTLQTFTACSLTLLWSSTRLCC